MEVGLRLGSTRYDPGSQLRFVEATALRPRLGPQGTTHRHVKNTGDYDVTVALHPEIQVPVKVTVLGDEGSAAE